MKLIEWFLFEWKKFLGNEEDVIWIEGMLFCGYFVIKLELVFLVYKRCVI